MVSTDEDKVFDVKYVRHASHLNHRNDISPSHDDITTDGSFKFHLGRIHITFLYKLVVQLQVSIATNINYFIANIHAYTL